MTTLTSEDGFDLEDEIWRKVRGAAVPNRLYTKAFHLETFLRSGLKVTSVLENRFSGETERVTYNATAAESDKLGESYSGHAAVTVYSTAVSPLE